MARYDRALFHKPSLKEDISHSAGAHTHKPKQAGVLRKDRLRAASPKQGGSE